MIRLSAQNISVKTKSGKVLLSPISFDQATGAVLGVYGPNGSGKTTLLKMMAGLRSDHENTGEFWVGSAAITENLPASEKVKEIVYLGSDFHSPFELTVRELFEMGASVGSPSLWPEAGTRERGRISEVVESMSLLDYLPRLFSTLSDGEKQLVMFARALIQGPKVLILDESFSKLDLDHLMLVAKELRRGTGQGMTFVVAAHDLNFLSEISEDLLFLKKTQLIGKGKVFEVLTASILETLYPGLSIQVVRSPETGKFKVLY